MTARQRLWRRVRIALTIAGAILLIGQFLAGLWIIATHVPQW